MNQAITSELRFFLTSVVWGLILLVIYDCIRIIRNVIHHGAVLISLEDIAYWSIGGFLIFKMMYELNNGIIRGFSLLGILLGMVIYKFSISDFAVKWISFLLIKIKQFLIRIIGLFLRPIRFLAGKCNRLLRFLGHKGGTFGRFLGRGVSKFVRDLIKALKGEEKRGKIKDTDTKPIKERKKPAEKQALKRDSC